MLQHTTLIQSVGHRHRLAVVGDRNVSMASFLRGRGHGLEIVAAVGRGRVHVQVAAQVGERNQAGKAAWLGRLDFAVMFAQFRLDPGEIRALRKCLLPSRPRSGGRRPD